MLEQKRKGIFSVVHAVKKKTGKGFNSLYSIQNLKKSVGYSYTLPMPFRARGEKCMIKQWKDFIYHLSLFIIYHSPNMLSCSHIRYTDHKWRGDGGNWLHACTCILLFRCFVLNSCYQNVKMYLMDYCFIFLFRYFTPMTKCVLSTVHSCYQSHSVLNMLLFNVVIVNFAQLVFFKCKDDCSVVSSSLCSLVMYLFSNVI